MDNNKVHIDNLYQEKQESFATVPPGAWHDMEKRLESDSKNRSIYRWWWIMFGIILVVFVVYLSISKLEEPRQIRLKRHSENITGTSGRIKERTPSAGTSLIMNTIVRTNIRQTDSAEKLGLRRQLVVSSIKILNTVVRQRTGAQSSQVTHISKKNNKDLNAVSDILDKKEAITIQIDYSSIMPAVPDQNSQADTTHANRRKSRNNESTIAEVSPHTNGNDTLSSPVTRKKMKKHFEFGFKAGYEIGIQNIAISKLIAAPYVRYFFTDKVSISFQPTIKTGKAKYLQAPAAQSYYRPAGTAADTQVVFMQGAVWNLYTFHHTYDSIAIMYKALNKLIDLELPLIVHYQLSPTISTNVGFTFTKGRLISIHKEAQIFPDLVKTDTFLRLQTGTATHPIDTSASFHHIEPLYTNNVLETYNTTGLNPLRIGYLIGINFEQQRWMAEFTMNQQISPLPPAARDLIRKMYTQPHFRLLFGLKF